MSKIDEMLRSNYYFVPDSEREDIKEMKAAILSVFKEMVEKAEPEKKKHYALLRNDGKECRTVKEWKMKGYNEALDECRANLLKAIEEEGE